MNSLEIDDDAFYICTELTPRCYVFQKAIQIDRTQIQRVVGDLDKLDRPFDAAPPPAPQLPHWFTAECRNHLVNCGEPAPSAVPTTVLPMSSGPSPVPPLSLADLKYQLKAQLEYYFSRENLITDRYLRCQMDADQYVPIAVIAGFRKIIQLTTDYNLVLEALRGNIALESTQVEVDEKGEKVRPLCKRCTIILREIAEEQKTDVEGMLSGGPAFIDLKYGLNNSWYVTYDNEETTQRAYLHLQSLDRPICARIKAGGPPTDLSAIERAPTAAPDPSLMSPELGIPFVPMMTLTDALASFRFVPTATFRPSSTVVHVEEDQKARRGAPRNMTSPRGGGRGGGHNMVLHKNYTGGVGMQTNGVAGSGYPQMNGIMHQQHNYMGPAQQTQFVDRDRRVNNGRGRGGGMGVSNASGPRRGGGNDKTYHQGGRRNGGGQNRPRREMWNNGMVGQQQQQQQQSCALPSLSVSTGDLASATAQTSPQMTVERPRYHSYRRERTDDGTSFEQDRNMATGSTGSASGRARRWESESETDRDSNRKTSSVISGGSAYSFEERAFPCLSEPKPEPEKPVQKPTFSSVAAGKRFAKPEPKKSYAEKLKEKGATHL